MAIAGMVVLSGFLMSIYALLQYSGYDLLTWDSQYLMVGTFTNPNFLGAFLAVTAIFTLGLALDPNLRRTPARLIFLGMFAMQFAALMISNKAGSTLTFCFGLVLLFTRGWEVRPGKTLRISPLLSGFLIAMGIVLFHGLVFYATSTYPWETLQTPPSHHFPIVTRLILWQMGFAVFLTHPFTGLGPGSLPYMMPMERPPFGSAVGIKIFNDDPHSAALSILAETGIFGLIAVCSIFAVIYGCFVWFRFKNSREPDMLPMLQENLNGERQETVAPATSPTIEPLWGLTIITFIITCVASWLNFLPRQFFIYIVPFTIAAFGIHNSFRAQIAKSYQPSLPNLPKATIVALLALIFNSLFNNSLAVIPITGFALVIFGLHFSGCQRDIVWKRKFSFVSVLFIAFPAMYVFAAYNFQIAYHHEQVSLFNGETNLTQQKYPESQKDFETAIMANPQSLKAHYGLALSLEMQNLLDESQDMFKRLDSMVPNAYNSNFELARILLERKHILEAHRYALKSLQWDQAPKAYELLGRILSMEGKFSEAEKIFTEGLLLVPLNTFDMQAADRIRVNLAAIMASRGDFAQCEKYLEGLRTSVQDGVDTLYLRGMLLSRQDKAAEALELFEQALKQEPKNPRFLNAVGYILTQTGQDLERAGDLLESAHAIIKGSNPPNLSDLLMVAHSLGKLYWKTNKIREAHQLLKIAYEQCPDEWQTLKSERFADLKTFCEQNRLKPDAEISAPVTTTFPAVKKETLTAPEAATADRETEIMPAAMENN